MFLFINIKVNRILWGVGVTATLEIKRGSHCVGNKVFRAKKNRKGGLVYIKLHLKKEYHIKELATAKEMQENLQWQTPLK